MIEIIFQNKEEAVKLFDFFHNHKPEADILLFEDKNIVQIEPHSIHSIYLLRENFYQFITNIKQNDWFRRILREHYYYEDEEEQQQILEIIQSVIEGKRADLQSFIEGLNKDENLKTSINEVFKENISFSFDSFVRFRLRPFMIQLERFVEIAIDEYKMEQEYQMFIQTLRDFIDGRSAQLDHLYLLIHDGINFYNDQLHEIKRGELMKLIDRKLLSNHPVYIDSVTIAPLLSIAPLKIFLYTDDPNQPLVRTIQNIFEERVIIKSITCFQQLSKEYSINYNEKDASFP